MTYGGHPYGDVPYGGGEGEGAPPPDPFVFEAFLTGFGSLRWEAPPRAALTAEGVLEVPEAVAGRSGGSTALVDVQPEGKGTKVLIGSTARVVVRATGVVARVPPYNVHPNAREDTNYVPEWNVALASLLRDEQQEPPSSEGRQLVMLSSPSGTTDSDEDDFIFDVDHRG